MMIIASTTLLIPLLAASASASGDTLTLDLSQAILLALDESHSAQVLDLSLAGAEHDVAAAKGRFGARADARFSLPELEEGVQRVQVPGDLPRYDSYGSREVSAILQLSQPLPTDGEVSLSGHLYQQDDSYYDQASEQTQEQRTFFNSYEVSLRQPLFTPNELKLGLEKAEIGHRLARRAYQRGQLDLSFQVTAAFYMLVEAQEELAIARDALERQQQNFDLAKRKYNAGLIPEVEALQMEVDLAGASNDLLGRESDLILSADRFRLLVGLPMVQPIRAEANLTPGIFEVDHGLALSHALAHRTEINDIQDRIRSSEITVTETNARSHLKGELSAFYNLTGISDPLLEDTGMGDLVESSWEDLKRRPGNRGVRFSLSVPLWDSGVNKQEVASAEVAVRRRLLDEEDLHRDIARQVQATLAEFEGAKRRLDVLGRSLDIALRSYGISRQRFEAGDITSQALADNRDRLVQARRSYLAAFVSYRLSGADLRRQTLYDFELGKSLVEGAGE
ncbi:MAG: TolC family protein [Candidatus Krumholzibacteriota bacterium]